MNALHEEFERTNLNPDYGYQDFLEDKLAAERAKVAELEQMANVDREMNRKLAEDLTTERAKVALAVDLIKKYLAIGHQEDCDDEDDSGEYPCDCGYADALKTLTALQSVDALAAISARPKWRGRGWRVARRTNEP